MNNAEYSRYLSRLQHSATPFDVIEALIDLSVCPESPEKMQLLEVARRLIALPSQRGPESSASGSITQHANETAQVRITIMCAEPTPEGPSFESVEWVASQVWDFFGSRPSRVYHFEGPVDLCFVGKPMPTQDALTNFVRRLDRAAVNHGIKITSTAVDLPRVLPAIIRQRMSTPLQSRSEGASTSGWCSATQLGQIPCENSAALRART